MAILNDTLIVAANSQVLAFELRTGEIIWKRAIKGEGIVIDKTRHRVYFSEISPSNRQIWAVDATTGETIWVNGAFNGQRTGLVVALQADGQPIAYVGIPGHKEHIRFMNSETGVFEKAPSIPDDTLFYWEGVSWQQQGMSLIAMDTASQQQLWRQTLPSSLSPPKKIPQIVEDTLFVQASTVSRWLVALDWRTGKLRWQYSVDSNDKLIVSNVEVDSAKVYLLDINAKLFIWDVDTGTLVHHIQFEPPQRRTGSSVIEGSEIAVEKNIIAIAFNDTNILSVMEVAEPDS